MKFDAKIECERRVRQVQGFISKGFLVLIWKPQNNLPAYFSAETIFQCSWMCDVWMAVYSLELISLLGNVILCWSVNPSLFWCVGVVASGSSNFCALLHFQGDLRRMWSEPFIIQTQSKNLDVWLWVRLSSVPVSVRLLCQ